MIDPRDRVLPAPSAHRQGRSPAVTALRAVVGDFCSLDGADLEPASLHHAVLAEVHQMCRATMACEAAGLSRADIVEVIAPVRAIHARSPFVARLQQWPRGYPGDFETIDDLWRAHNRVPPGSLAHHCEAYALGAPISQQHRNKVHAQAARMLATMLRSPGRSRILALAAGSCPDLELVQPQLEALAGELYLNDSDRAALAFAAPLVAPLGDRCHAVHGNALKVARRLEAVGRFDLVLAGGLFDYLPERHAVHLLRSVVHGLLGPGGTCFFTNIALGNPYRTLMEHVADWFLIERSQDAILALCAEAAIPASWVTVGRDATGLALLIEVTRP